MRETRTFTALAIGALILVMAAMFAAPAQARPPRTELEFKAAPQLTRYHESDGNQWARRTRTATGAAAMMVAAGALSLLAMQRTRAATT